MTTPTQGEHAQTALAHELFAAAQLAPGEGIEDAVSRIAAALTAATAQPAAPQGVAYAGPETLGVYCGIASDDVPDPTHPRYVAGFKAGHAAGKKRASHGQAPAAGAVVVPRETLVAWRQWCAQSMSHAIEHEISDWLSAAPTPTAQADSAQDEPLQAFDSPRAKALMRAWEEGWAACRDAEYVGEEAQNDAFNSSHTLTLCIAEDQQLPAPQVDSQPAPQGETNVQLDTDSNAPAPGQQRNMAGTVALGQPVGNGSDQAAGDPSAHGGKLLTVAERNIRSFLRSATFKSESDREAALNCVDVLYAAARAPADSQPAVQQWNDLIGKETHADADGLLVWRDEVDFAIPTPQADSVPEDAARLDWLQHNGATVEVTPGKPSYDWRFRVAGLHATTRNNIREAIDAARKQGAKHD